MKAWQKHKWIFLHHFFPKLFQIHIITSQWNRKNASKRPPLSINEMKKNFQYLNMHNVYFLSGNNSQTKIAKFSFSFITKQQSSERTKKNLTHLACIEMCVIIIKSFYCSKCIRSRFNGETENGTHKIWKFNQIILRKLVPITHSQNTKPTIDSSDRF